MAESWRNLTAVGARPLAVTDNMNFGNPQRPEIMGQFAGCIEGMREACLALDYPVVSGNVSLYNETNGKGILPTPVIGGVGLLADVARIVSIAFKAEGEAIVLIGETKGHLGCSLYLREIHGREDGPPPPVDLAAERRNGDFVRGLIGPAGSPPATTSPMAACWWPWRRWRWPAASAPRSPCPGISRPMASVRRGPGPLSRDRARAGLDGFLAAARKAGVPAMALGQTGGTALTLQGGDHIADDTCRGPRGLAAPAYGAEALS